MILGRLVPHFPNMVPLTVLSILAGVIFRKSFAVIITLFSLFISDMLLGFFQTHLVFGSWMLFTYSGCLFVMLFAPRSVRNNINVWSYLITSTFLYWLWTNLGTWLMTSLYSHNFSGVMNCFIAGLPFLRNAIIGNVIYMVIFLPVVRKYLKHHSESILKTL
jgi:hypothetical protein